MDNFAVLYIDFYSIIPEEGLRNSGSRLFSIEQQFGKDWQKNILYPGTKNALYGYKEFQYQKRGQK